MRALWLFTLPPKKPQVAQLWESRCDVFPPHTVQLQRTQHLCQQHRRGSVLLSVEAALPITLKKVKAECMHSS